MITRDPGSWGFRRSGSRPLVSSFTINPGPDAAQWYANNIAIWVAGISIIGVVINAVIAYLAVGQFRAAQASAEAARESVTAAHKSIEQAKDALEIGNRAWVHVSTIVPH